MNGLNQKDEEGLKTGLWITKYSNGAVDEIGTYLIGKRKGNWRCFSKNGNLFSEGYYDNDMPIGKFFFYFSNGNTQKEQLFNTSGLRIYEKQFYFAGNIQSERIFVR